MWSWYSYLEYGDGFRWELIVWDVIAVVPVGVVAWSVVVGGLNSAPMVVAVGPVGNLPVGVVALVGGFGLSTVYWLRRAVA